ncbi:hypothetical protein B0H17DRAFT_1138867 [Mycena rosella]|uniref:Uncharacterized protein n=1 Tax=Mycena rosella TaxID=1033263 RepID=A0AAD7D5F7_MYCRO|nr:hypothetical protein B0H17DRAFT_1138867 [Mycena rosella]
MGCGWREADSGKLSKIAGERVAQRRRRWDSEALQVISGEGVDEIVNTFANILRITHDGPVSSFFGWRTRQDPLMMGWKAIHFPPDLRCIIARSGGTTDGFDGTDHGALIVTSPLCFSAWAVYLQCGGTIWEKWDIWGIWEKGQTAPNDRIPSDAQFGKIRKTASAVGPNNRREHDLLSLNLCVVINGYLRPITRPDFVVIFGVLIIRDSAEPAACGGSGVDGIRARTTEPAAAAAAALMVSVRALMAPRAGTIWAVHRLWGAVTTHPIILVILWSQGGDGELSGGRALMRMTARDGDDHRDGDGDGDGRPSHIKFEYAGKSPHAYNPPHPRTTDAALHTRANTKPEGRNIIIIFFPEVSRSQFQYDTRTRQSG